MGTPFAHGNLKEVASTYLAKVVCNLLFSIVDVRVPSRLPDVSDKLVLTRRQVLLISIFFASHSFSPIIRDPISLGRFFERDVDAICEEEFCLVDNESGEPILLTREEKERIFLGS